MKKIEFTLVELLNGLQAENGVIKGHPSIKMQKKFHFLSHFQGK